MGGGGWVRRGGRKRGRAGVPHLDIHVTTPVKARPLSRRWSEEDWQVWGRGREGGREGARGEAGGKGRDRGKGERETDEIFPDNNNF